MASSEKRGHRLKAALGPATDEMPP